MISFHTNHRLLLVVPVAVFLLLSITIAILPALQQRTKYREPPDAKKMSPSVARGRAIYQRENCAVCHTQQVRMDTRQRRGLNGGFPPLAQDARYGPPSRPEDYSSDDPPFLGTERTGPDLHNVGARMPSKEWHLAHLFDPRLVVPGSVMPAYPWYFHTRQQGTELEVPLPTSAKAKYGDKFRVYWTEEAEDLVAYLLSLKSEAHGQ